MINVTKTFLPPQAEYQTFLKKAWDKHWLTNRGELVLELEHQLKNYLGLNNLTLTANGTLPLQIAIKSLGLTGEIITTPFSYVATTSSIVWEGCKPVFVDIHPEYLTIDETKIEAAISANTSAILATHVFGNPCHVEVIEAIAKKHKLKVIYDAAHCFGVNYKGESIFNYGDVSTCSFHATKLFHTGEGGCWITKSAELNKKMFYYHNFGHCGEAEFFDVGINAKMSELHAAMGLAVLPYVKKLIEERENIVNTYNAELRNLNLRTLTIREDTVWNSSYYPIILKDETILLKLIGLLKEHNINTRRYFYPSLNTLNYIDQTEMPISDDISKRVLCLPIYNGLSIPQVNIITGLIKKIVK
ncbi:DegT/DnrJ/EryC1/StrS family aminotransferase [Winogradskyella vidalii]|uniref:DegT/DnrJ/EryC1/StrS family aminotransferase n=1 Tax=Winogradskyella vidalii TaxID=2615024 RepID=UPI0015C87874|nr:DegT/DnrJ/EryC1/StrS family aminotransferase [Winogradskyella vidalii]